MSGKYRVVTDRYLGFEAQWRPWWWPFWMQIDGTNTRPSLEAAQELVAKHRQNTRRVVWTLADNTAAKP